MRFLLVLFTLTCPGLAQSTWFVDATGVPPGTGTALDPFTSLQAAIDAPTTVDGDRVLVASGVYFEQIDFQGKQILVDGSGSSPVPVLDGASLGSTVTFQNGEGAFSILRGFAITGGTGSSSGSSTLGGGIRCTNAGPSLEQLVIFGNVAGSGGGIAIEGGSPLLLSCTLESNQAELGGGIFVSSASLSMSACGLRGNEASGQFQQGLGGGIAIGTNASVTIDSSRFEGNSAESSGGGGALYCSSDSLGTNLLQTEFEGNSPGTFNGRGSGGAILAEGPLEATGCEFVNNGAVFGTFDTTLFGGAASGGTYVSCTFERNSAQFGGALSAATAVGCEFRNNTGCADLSGGGGAATGCDLQDCLLIGNVSCGNGGGAIGCTLTNCEVLNNIAGGTGTSPGCGGGLFNCTARQSRIHGNEAQGFGAPLFASCGGGAGASTLVQCQVSSNFAEEAGGLQSCSTDRCSIVGNAAVFSFGGLAGGTHRSSIVWSNGPVPTQPGIDIAYSNVEGGAAGPGNIDQDPLLFGPAGSDLHLMTGSPSIDSASPTAPLDPDGSPADMGALPFDANWTAGAAVYCQSQPTIDQCVPRMVIEGQASLGGPGDIVFRGDNIHPNQFGLLFHGQTPAFTPFVGSSPFQGGFNCVGPPIVRMGVISSTQGPGDCDGVLVQALSDAEILGLGLVPGDRLYAQFWFRQGVSGLVAFTDAAEVPILP